MIEVSSVNDLVQVARSNDAPARAYGPKNRAIEAINRERKDPSAAINGMAPNYGASAFPHVASFQGIISGLSQTYWHSDEALKDSYENARYMRNDPMVMECVEQRQRSCALLDWTVLPEDEKNKEHKQLADEVAKIIRKTPRFMQYRENLLHAVFFGRYGIKHRWHRALVGNEWRWCLKNWVPVHGDKLLFKFDELQQEDRVGVRVGAGFGVNLSPAFARWWELQRGSKKIEATPLGLGYFLDPWEKPLLSVHKHYIEDGEYEAPENAGRIHGVGIRSRLYWIWFQKQETMAWGMEFLERSALGLEIWYYPWGSDEGRAKVQEAAMDRIGNGRNIIFVPKPLGEQGMAYGYDRIEPAMGGHAAIQSMVQEYFGHLIKRFILGQTLTSESSGTGLGSNLADVHVATFMQIVKYDATNLEETITADLVKHIVAYNFPKYQGVPLRFVINTEEPDVDAKLAAWQRCYEMGAAIPEQELLSMVGAGIPPADARVLSMERSSRVQAAIQLESQQATMAMQMQAQQAQAQQAMAAQGQKPPVQAPDTTEQDAAKLHAELADKGVAEPPPSENGERQQMYARRKKFALAREHLPALATLYGLSPQEAAGVTREFFDNDPKF